MLANRVAIITGGASGLGRAAVTRFAKAGAKVAIVDLPTQPGAELAQSLGKDVIFTPADVTSEEQIKNVLDTVLAKFGRAPNAVVQCAGIAYAAKVLGKKGPHPLDVFEKTLRINTVGTFNVARLAAERMAATEPLKADENDKIGERGVIINTASIAAFEGQVGQAAYSASKGAVVGMMLPLARELSKNLIRVNTIAPGLFLTPLLMGLPPKVQDELAADVPFPSRLGIPEEYGALAEHIVSNRYINGEVVRIDGGLRMKP